MRPLLFSGILGHSALVISQTLKPYSCNNNFNICQNICYYTGCAHPFDGLNRDPATLTRSSNGPVGQRRRDCGVNHSPRPCTSQANGGLGLPGFGSSADEYPFASTVEGGLTPYGDGAGLLCVPPAEQNSQGGKVNNLWNQAPQIANGQQVTIVLQDTAGIPYCDSSATTPGVFCDGSEFSGVHFFVGDNIYCQWQVSTTSASCYDGRTGAVTQPPNRIRDLFEEGSRIPFGFQNLMHIRYPGLAEGMWNEERDGPMPKDQTLILNISQWLTQSNLSQI